MYWSDLEGAKIKRVLCDGDLEFAKQNNLPESVYLVLNNGTTVTIRAMPSENDSDPRPWLKVSQTRKRHGNQN